MPILKSLYCMEKIIGPLLLLHCALIGCSQSKDDEYKRLKITQTALMLYFSADTVSKNPISDSVFIITGKRAGDIRIVQLPLYPLAITEKGTVEMAPVFNYFVYTPLSHTGLYLQKMQKMAGNICSADSVIKSKVDKYIGIDTLRCLKEEPVVYASESNDVIYAFSNKMKSDENYDFDSVKFMYTTNRHLYNNYLSKLMSIRDGRFLYKVIFFFRQTVDKRINKIIPEREVKIEIAESKDIDKAEIRYVLSRYKLAFH